MQDMCLQFLGFRVTVCVTTHAVATVAETDHAVAADVEQIHPSLTITSHTFCACLFSYGFAVVVMISNICSLYFSWLGSDGVLEFAHVFGFSSVF